MNAKILSVSLILIIALLCLGVARRHFVLQEKLQWDAVEAAHGKLRRNADYARELARGAKGLNKLPTPLVAAFDALASAAPDEDPTLQLDNLVKEIRKSSFNNEFGSDLVTKLTTVQNRWILMRQAEKKSFEDYSAWRDSAPQKLFLLGIPKRAAPSKL